MTQASRRPPSKQPKQRILYSVIEWLRGTPGVCERCGVSSPSGPSSASDPASWLAAGGAGLTPYQDATRARDQRPGESEAEAVDRLMQQMADEQRAGQFHRGRSQTICHPCADAIIQEWLAVPFAPRERIGYVTYADAESRLGYTALLTESDPGPQGKIRHYLVSALKRVDLEEILLAAEMQGGQQP